MSEYSSPCDLCKGEKCRDAEDKRVCYDHCNWEADMDTIISTGINALKEQILERENKNDDEDT